jgi:hypothetical protein
VLSPYIEYAMKYVDWQFLWLLGNGFVAAVTGGTWLAGRLKVLLVAGGK